MKESTKGALLSLLVYPGLGQLLMGLKISGILFAGMATIGLLVIMYRITVRMVHAIDPILSSAADKTLKWSDIVNIFRQGHYDSWQVEGICLIFLLIFWMAAGFHAYFAGRRIDDKSG